MATKSIAWTTGTGNITLTYQGQGDGTIAIQSSPNDLGSARSQIITVETVGGAVTKNLTVRQAACPFPVGTVENYSYTGSVQSVELPAGQYKLQCWGAQGGSNAAASSYGITAQVGGKGGYSEGVLTLNSATTLYIFVGGQGSSSGNGGWNGGGGCYDGYGEKYVDYEMAGYYFTTSGNYGNSADWGVTKDFISVSPGDTIKWTYDGNNSYSVAGSHCLIFYNSNKLVIDNWGANSSQYGGTRTITASSNTYYIRASYVIGTDAKIYVNNTLVWEPKKYYGTSRFGGGGGGTDIALTTSTMIYSSYRTNRNSASLLSRIIVAGGGSGGAMSYVNKKTDTVSTATVNWVIEDDKNNASNMTFSSSSGNASFSCASTSTNLQGCQMCLDLSAYVNKFPLVVTFTVASSGGSSTLRMAKAVNRTEWASPYTSEFVSVGSGTGSKTITMGDTTHPVLFYYCNDNKTGMSITGTKISWIVSSSSTSNNSQVGYVGGGTSGGGYSDTYKGRQNAAGSNGEFGNGATQNSKYWIHISSAGGGGWYGGGKNQGNADANNVKQSGGGSGFVNTTANAQYRPTGYTGLELDSGTTYAGNTSFPNTSGTGNEKGHSGNGYAKITRLA